MQTLSTEHSPPTARPSSGTAAPNHEREVLKLAIRSLLVVWSQTRLPGARPEPGRLH